ncbi:700_t:CDS:1, partial [Acaulospora colombiana]
MIETYNNHKIELKKCEKNNNTKILFDVTCKNKKQNWEIIMTKEQLKELI